MLAPGQRLVALYIDVHIGRHSLRHLVHAVGSAAVRGRSHTYTPPVGSADLRNFLRIGGDDNVVKRGAGPRSLVNMRQHGSAIDITQDFAWQAGGSQPGGNDGDSFHRTRSLAENREK